MPRLSSVIARTLAPVPDPSHPVPTPSGGHGHEPREAAAQAPPMRRAVRHRAALRAGSEPPRPPPPHRGRVPEPDREGLRPARLAQAEHDPGDRPRGLEDRGGGHLRRADREPDRGAQPGLPEDQRRRLQGAGPVGQPRGRPEHHVRPGDGPRPTTPGDEFGTDDGVKSKAGGGVPPKTPNSILNIWVCNLGGGLLGYAQFPGGPARTDGVVILYTAFGTQGVAADPFNLGRTATHEVGHYLNLRHIWGDTNDCSGSDMVADTPNCAGPNYGTPPFPTVTCNNGPNGDMFMNYMDYVDDTAMVMFTTQQVLRMRTALETSRSGLL